MPWEITIRRHDGAPLGDLESVRQQITSALPAMQFYREPSGVEKIAAARAAGIEFPEIIRQHMEKRPATDQAAFETYELSVRMYGFNSQPLVKI